MYKFLFLFLLLLTAVLLFPVSIFSENISIQQKNYLSFALALYPPNHKGYETEGFAPVDFEKIDGSELNDKYPGTVDGDARDLGTTGVEFKATYTHEIKIPFLKGDSSLTNGNNATVKLKGEFSPISVNGVADFTLTPIAFLNINCGSSLGTGWTALGIIGLGENSYEEDEIKSQPFSGIVTKNWTGVTFQFDLGALIPGDWTHVVFVANQQIEYKYYSAADDDTPWEYEASGGENFNGFRWNQTYFLGYMMPTKPFYIDTVGFITETEQRITKKNDSKMSEGGWGSDFMKINFGPLVNFKFTKTSWFTVLVQFKTAPDYTDETTGNAHFMKRQVDTDSDTYLYFNRIAFSMGIEI
ncbi:MAG: hypothetical protein JW982_00310 [Spirochaetes bacterium]|nr:hypothetical protein [Spirochaetota bacterium]